MKLTLPFHSYEHRSRQFASRRLVNCYAEQAPAQAKGPIGLLRAPGIRAWVTLPSSPVRGMCVHNGDLFAVSGGNLYTVNSSGDSRLIGAIGGSGRVQMASNGAQLIIVATPHGYVYDGTLEQITDEDFTSRGAAGVAVIDSFALFIEPGSGRFFGSSLLDATAYDSLDFATAEGAPDDLVSILVDHRQVFLFGTDTIELWYNSGSDGFPFAREANGMIEVGCGAINSPARADNAVFWLDNQRIARRLSDLTPLRISTHALEQQWQTYETVEDAYSFAMIHEGHTFWCLAFPSGGTSFIYDIATGEWHERRSRLSTGSDTYWRAAAHAYAYGKNVVGDTRSGRLGLVEATTYTEFGEILRMEWTYPNVYGEGRRAFHRRLQIESQAGVGITTGQGSSPNIMLSVSDDGGMTFTPVPNRSIGAVGQYKHRSTWNRLGSSYDRVYRAAVSDPVPVTVWDTQLEVEGGRI